MKRFGLGFVCGVAAVVVGVGLWGLKVEREDAARPRP
jgi:hypothetical protein